MSQTEINFNSTQTNKQHEKNFNVLSCESILYKNSKVVYKEDSISSRSSNKSDSVLGILFVYKLTDQLEKLLDLKKTAVEFDPNWYIFGDFSVSSDSSIRRIKNKHFKKAKLRSIRSHDFRRSHASILLDRGYDVMYISQRLGHKNVSMTLNTYSHLMPSNHIKYEYKIKYEM